jgi:hypothetical protein
MAAIITIQDVQDFYPNTLSNNMISRLIDFVSAADTCLDANAVPEAAQELLKLLAVAHLLSVQSGGDVKSETDMDGASVTFRDIKSSSPFIDQLRSMPGYSCIQSLVDKPKRFAAAVGC